MGSFPIKQHRKASRVDNKIWTADFIEGIHHFAFDDVTVMNIVYEEAEGYFQRQKDMESVVGMIQNRVGLYLQEQMK